MAIINQVPTLVAAKFNGEENINLKQIQRDTGLNYSTVSSWMKDRVDRVDFPILETWCKYLGVQPGDILIYEPSNK